MVTRVGEKYKSVIYVYVIFVIMLFYLNLYLMRFIRFF
jgi:hypothetical protein